MSERVVDYKIQSKVVSRPLMRAELTQTIFFGGTNVCTNSGLSKSFWLGCGGCPYDGCFSLDLVEGLYLAHTGGRVGGAEKRKPGNCHCDGCCDCGIRDCCRVDGGPSAYCLGYSVANLIETTFKTFKLFKSPTSFLPRVAGEDEGGGSNHWNFWNMEPVAFCQAENHWLVRQAIFSTLGRGRGVFH